MLTNRSLCRYFEPHLVEEQAQLYLFEYITRPRYWLRRALRRFLRAQDVFGDGAASGADDPAGDPAEYAVRTRRRPGCATMHVRRADSNIAVHRHGSQRTQARYSYAAVDRYLRAAAGSLASRNITEIFLVTDSALALAEARASALGARFAWRALKRPRFDSNEGGWENHWPSRDPKHEVTVILATMRLARRCTDLFIGDHHSFFGRLLRRSMCMGRDAAAGGGGEGGGTADGGGYWGWHCKFPGTLEHRVLIETINKHNATASK